MSLRSNKLKSIVLAIAAMTSGLSLSAQDGEAVFKQFCSACHTVGGGKMVGPDLEGLNSKRSEDWVINFVKDAASFSATDADAKAMVDEYGYPMPSQNVSDDEIKAIISYIAANSSSGEEATAEAEVEEAAPAAPADPAEDPANASEADVLAGQQLFSGEKSFENGGPSCITCHTVQHDALTGGGLLAKDLTMVYERMGAAGINGMLANPAFPAMAASYGEGDEITKDEIFQLQAFFYQASTTDVYQHTRGYDHLLIMGGGGAFIVFAIIIFLMFLERKKKCVKQDIYDRQIKSACSK